MNLKEESGYKQTPIGKIPEEWEVVRLGEVITYVKGKKPEIMVEEYQEECLPYLSTDYLRNGKATQFVRITGSEIVVEEGDIILLWDGSN
ncbi:MAG TPA: restriction endonuclease subunit S, partial [Thermoplasmatales archaeon]|nr:restriction endonuclease subunit S [Thermoplasmatales archaeon]